MPDYADWLIRVRTEDGIGFWVLEHVPCGWTSKSQFEPETRSVADVLRWIDNHAPRWHRHDG